MNKMLEFPGSQDVNDVEDLLTIEDLKRIFHVQEKTARKYYQQYGLRAIRLPGREVRFTREAVREFIRRCEEPQAAS